MRNGYQVEGKETDGAQLSDVVIIIILTYG